MEKFAVMNLFFCCLFFWLICGLTTASFSSVALYGNPVTIHFRPKEASSATPPSSVSVKGEGLYQCGTLYVAEPVDACSPLQITHDNNTKSYPPMGGNAIVLIAGGGRCNLDDKIRTAQDAGFQAAIIYGDLDQIGAGYHLFPMFASKDSGERLSTYAAGLVDMELCISPDSNVSKYRVAVGLIILVGLLVINYSQSRDYESRINRDHVERVQLVKAIPTVIFTGVVSEDYDTSRKCVICLGEYIVGEKLRILLCRHRFHLVCLDEWLCWRQTFCPFCKQDAITRSSTTGPEELC